MDELARARAERDLFAALLELHRVEELEPALRGALKAIVQASGAERGYVEVRAEDEARWWLAQGFDDTELETIQTLISTGILGEAIATGETIQTQSALFDLRFADRRSVRRNQIAAVICAPLAGRTVDGVLYVQGPSGGAGGLREGARELVEVFARELGPLVDRLGAEQAQRDAVDPTKPWRARLAVDGVVGRSEALARVLRGIALAAPIPATVLLTGPTGSGKTRLARAIHDSGPRAAQRFLELNCAALPDELVESELFGALPGGHSTATKRMIGKVEAADGGTLFLDEIGELTPAAQSKLLTFLESGRYFPLGSSEALKSSCRIVAATNVDLKEAVQEGRFRQDLFYRLHVLTVDIPPLSARRDDVVPLARHFCRATASRYGAEGLTLTAAAEAALEDADWPGNVRELANTVERGVLTAMAEEADAVGVSHVFESDQVTSGEFEGVPVTWQAGLRRAKRRLLRSAIEAEGGNMTAVARRLGLARSQIYKLREALGV